MEFTNQQNATRQFQSIPKNSADQDRDNANNRRGTREDILI